MFDPQFVERLFPTPEAIDALGDDAAERLLQLSKSYAPIEVDFAELADQDKLTEHFKLAKAAAAKFKKVGYPSLTTEEQQALHAFVHLVTRPSLQTREGKVFGVPKDSWPLLAERRSVVNRLLKGVGRLDAVSGDERTLVGSGWFVAGELVMTNNHVVAALCEINPHAHPTTWRAMLGEAIDGYNTRWKKDPDTRPAWDPADDPADDPSTAPGRVVRADLHPSLDLAVLRVEGVKDSHRLAIPIADAGPSESEHRVYALGYPAVQANGPLHPALVKFLFNTSKTGMIKRVAPGQLLAVGVSPVGHDATTLGGSSGSAIVDFESNFAVGLHFSGRYGVRNNAVPLWQHKEDPFFGTHGVAFV